MKKQIRFVSFLLFFALILPLVGSASAFAMTENAAEAAAADEADSMIYASGDELEYAYNALWADWHIPAALECDELSVVKESITPIYYIDTLEYARTGVMTIERAFAGGLDTEPLYIVKLVDKEGNFAGNMTFRVKDGVAKPSGQTIVSEDGFCTASCSYADHAERIRKYLGEDELIPPTDVIFVLAKDICQFFYIKNEKYDLFFAIGCLPTNYTKKYCVGEDDMAVDAAKLKALSDRQLQRHEEQIAEYREWKAEHPDEPFSSTGGYGGESVSSVCSELNDIKDISNYFNIDFSVNRGMPDYVKLPGEQPAHSNGIMAIIAASGAALTVVAVALITFAVKKKKTNNV